MGIYSSEKLNYSDLFEIKNKRRIKMNHGKISKFTNRVAFVGIVLLIYWVIILIVTFVFGLKVFGENITQAFFSSILGILAILSGAVILNVMANLSRIADAVSNKGEGSEEEGGIGKYYKLFIVSIPILLVLMFGGDFLSAKAKEKRLVRSAENLVQENRDVFDQLVNYSFTRDYLEKSAQNIRLLGKIDRNFPTVRIVVLDEVERKKVLLGFSEWANLGEGNSLPSKINYIFSTTEKDREFLFSSFSSEDGKLKFSAHDGNYELFYPVVFQGKKIVLYLSDRQYYGKLGS